jgi:hypothetical protein
MLALGQHLHQALRFQPLQMHARGCWRVTPATTASSVLVRARPSTRQ